jgi:hypothetical protein
MATWTNVPNTVLEPGDPIRSVDIIAIKENIIALSEGASGAPKIQLEALQAGIVLTATASASVGAVGTYALLFDTVYARSLAAGATAAGSSLRYSSTTAVSSGTPSGTWRVMGFSAFGSGGNGVTVMLRIS